MLREIIKVKSSDYTIHILEEYLDQEVEILVLSYFINFENIDINKIREKAWK